MHTMDGHRDAVSSMAMEHDQKGFFSAGWDGEAFVSLQYVLLYSGSPHFQQWDLNTGKIARNFRSHGSQLTSIAVRPLANFHPWEGPSIDPAFVNANPPVGEIFPPGPMNMRQSHEPMDFQPTQPEPPPQAQGPPPVPLPAQDEDSKSDASFDPLFDDDPEANVDGDQQMNGINSTSGTADGGIAYPMQTQMSTASAPVAAAAPKNAPPVLDPLSYATYSPDILMIASIDGQIVLWDKRVFTPGRGVGRLWMDAKTPPWCVSVS